MYFMCAYYSRFYEKFIDYSEDVTYFIPAVYFLDFYDLRKINIFSQFDSYTDLLNLHM